MFGSPYVETYKLIYKVTAVYAGIAFQIQSTAAIFSKNSSFSTSVASLGYRSKITTGNAFNKFITTLSNNLAV